MQNHKLNDISECLVNETREIEALTEAIAQRDRYEQLKLQTQSKLKDLQQELQEIQSGKTTFKSIFSKGNKDESTKKIQEQIETVPNTSLITLLGPERYRQYLIPERSHHRPSRLPSHW